VPGLGDLRAFVAVAEERSFTHAAERLHVAQEALSKSVAELERELGVDLLDHAAHDVRLTRAGEALLADAPGVLAAADAAFARARGHGRGLAGSLAIGVTAAVGPGVLDHALGALRRDAPALSIVIREVGPSEVAPRLRDRSLDVVFARSAQPEPGLEAIELPPTPAALVVPERHPLASREVVELGALDGERLLTWSVPGSPYADLLVEMCRHAGAYVEPVGSAIGGGRGVEPVGSATGGGSGVEPVGSAIGGGRGVEPVGSAIGGGRGVEPVGSATGGGRGVEPVGSAIGGGRGVEPVGSAIGGGTGVEPVGSATGGGTGVEPVGSATGGGTDLRELVALGAVALAPVRWPRVPGTVRVPLAGDVTLPLVAIRAVGPAAPHAARLLEALRA
jgi:DNA-binding transcriptional LysR family regulator